MTCGHERIITDERKLERHEGKPGYPARCVLCGATGFVYLPDPSDPKGTIEPAGEPGHYRDRIEEGEV